MMANSRKAFAPGVSARANRAVANGVAQDGDQTVGRNRTPRKAAAPDAEMFSIRGPKSV